ncbi:hypothetical protein HK099_002515 [Clydaea vesicula]|uniref:Uncharacterized protein n=1 Tax=Clydaea vesicula TaxID=447962 RepID=A0AAD5TTE9_9FUNG|nr:hypothetical protein HK099_002515 [Clydaea vesicula]
MADLNFLKDADPEKLQLILKILQETRRLKEEERLSKERQKNNSEINDQIFEKNKKTTTKTKKNDLNFFNQEKKIFKFDEIFNNVTNNSQFQPELGLNNFTNFSFTDSNNNNFNLLNLESTANLLQISPTLSSKHSFDCDSNFNSNFGSNSFLNPASPTELLNGSLPGSRDKDYLSQTTNQQILNNFNNDKFDTNVDKELQILSNFVNLDTLMNDDDEENLLEMEIEKNQKKNSQIFNPLDFSNFELNNTGYPSNSLDSVNSNSVISNSLNNNNNDFFDTSAPPVSFKNSVNLQASPTFNFGEYLKEQNQLVQSYLQFQQQQPQMQQNNNNIFLPNSLLNFELQQQLNLEIQKVGQYQAEKQEKQVSETQLNQTLNFNYSNQLNATTTTTQKPIQQQKPKSSVYQRKLSNSDKQKRKLSASLQFEIQTNYFNKEKNNTSNNSNLMLPQQILSPNTSNTYQKVFKEAAAKGRGNKQTLEEQCICFTCKKNMGTLYLR